MPTLHIHLLSDFRLTFGDAPVTKLSASRLQALLAYLVLHRDAPQSRQHLAFLLWADSNEAQARTNLRQLLHSLKQTLPAVEDFVHVDAQTLQWRADAPFRLDVAEFEQALSAAASAEQQGDIHALQLALEQASAIYQGDLLPSCYDDWILLERERLRQAFTGALERLLLLWERQGQPRAAIACAQRLVRHDPLREETYRALMRLYVACGDRAGALRVYYTCATVLERELGVEPSAATREAYEHLLMVDAPARPVLPAPPSNTNLPLPLTSFVGREVQMAQIRDLVQATRLLTLTGPGGCGKTRLAQETATNLLGEYSDGVWWVELAALSDAALVPQAVATALGVREQSGQPLVETLVGYLRAKQLLLLLDNCEHLVGACAHLTAQWLSACPHLRILATSREALSIGGETTWLVPALSLPQAQPASTVEELMRYEAIRLFADRATTVLPTFRLTAANGPLVAQICRRLDGMPLAIELAAARVKLLTAEQIAARLDDVFQLLTAGRRTALLRHQTLRAALDWSYDLLSDQERVLFRRLAVFVGGFELRAAERVCADLLNGDPEQPVPHRLAPAEVLDLLTHLVDKSFVSVEQAGPEARYFLLQTVREYARERLDEANELDALRTRQLMYYVWLAEYYRQLSAGKPPVEVLDRLEREHDNVRAALDWSQQDANRAELGMRLAVAAAQFWEARGYYREGRRWLENLLGQTPLLRPTGLRVQALYQLGLLAGRQGDYALASTYFDEGLAIARKLEDKRMMAEALSGLAGIAFNRGEYERAKAFHEQALTLWQELGDVTAIAVIHLDRGIWANLHGDYVAANQQLEAALSTFRATDNTEFTGHVLTVLGNVALVQGHLERAEPFYAEALAIRTNRGDHRGVSVLLSQLAAIAHAQGEFGRAAQLCEDALAVQRELGSKQYLALTLQRFGLVALNQGNCRQAVERLQESLTLCQAVGNRHPIGSGLVTLAYIAAACGYPERAARLLAAGQRVFQELHLPMDYFDRQWHDRAEARALAQLPEAAFAAAAAEGRAMTLDEAVADALSLTTES